MPKIRPYNRKRTKPIPLLVIESNADHWLTIRSVLSQCFPEVKPIWINSLPQALSHLDAQPAVPTQLPCLILLEPYLPRREDGLELLKFIKSHMVYQQIPVVMLTNSKAPEDIKAGYEFSVASYIIKPATRHDWLNQFYIFRRYWWEVVSLSYTGL